MDSLSYLSDIMDYLFKSSITVGDSTLAISRKKHYIGDPLQCPQIRQVIHLRYFEDYYKD